MSNHYCDPIGPYTLIAHSFWMQGRLVREDSDLFMVLEDLLQKRWFELQITSPEQRLEIFPNALPQGTSTIGREKMERNYSPNLAFGLIMWSMALYQFEMNHSKGGEAPILAMASGNPKSLTALEVVMTWMPPSCTCSEEKEDFETLTTAFMLEIGQVQSQTLLPDMEAVEQLTAYLEIRNTTR